MEQCIVHAHASTRVFEHIYAVCPEPEPSYPIWPVPALRPGQGPSLPRAHPYCCPPPANPIMCFECMEPKPDHLPCDCPSHGRCTYCGSEFHDSDMCVAPHLQCAIGTCCVPIWHANHGTQCTAPLAVHALQLLAAELDAFLTPEDLSVGTPSYTSEDD
jgi:hypothetical protein